MGVAVRRYQYTLNENPENKCTVRVRELRARIKGGGPAGSNPGTDKWRLIQTYK